MSYTPTEWKNGDTITAEKLNNIEEGIENSRVLFVTTIDSYIDGGPGDYHLDKTIGEIRSAYESGKIVVFCQHSESESNIDSNYQILDVQYYVSFQNSEVYSTSGTVRGYRTGIFSVESPNFEEPPSSLEEVVAAFDAQYPYMTD